ncbi:MAG: site-specific integrase, partial [Sphingobium sp.]|nr:site-specific integrase [Sphingobium sp.]
MTATDEARPISRSDAALIDRYLAMLAAERGAARNTLVAYRNDLTDAARHIGNLGEADGAALGVLSKAWSSLTTSTLARKSSVLRGFFGFLEAEGIRLDNPSAALPRPVTRRPLPKVLSHADVDALFAVIKERTDRAAPDPKD